jgi:hypothetical protein
MRGAVVVAVVLGAWSPSPARADDKARAAEHFALAQSAEKRRDWRQAIEEYEEAYRLSPHPSVLYNIGLDHEHLSRWRDAARYFLRYVDEAPGASDREAVLARVRALREKTSSVTISVRPSGARVYVDGNERGRAPVILPLAGGRTYEVIAMDGRGNQSAPRRIAPEYGESFTLALDLDAGEDEPPPPGNESPDSRADAAAPTTTTTAMPPPVGPAEPPPAGGAKLVTSGGFGYHTNDQGARITYGLGYRSPGNHVDLGLLTGLFGEMAAVGGELRLYFTAAAVRPYLRVSWLYGWQENASSARAYEGGGGLLVSTSASAVFGLDYYLEVMGHRRTVEEERDLVDPLPPEDADNNSIAVVLGVGARLGR